MTKKKFTISNGNIELEVTVTSRDPLLGYCKLRICNFQLGTEEDLIYLKGYLLGGFVDILSSPINKNGIKDVELDDFFKESASEKTLKFNKVNFGTFTDDFLIRAFRDEEDIFIIWKFITPKKDLIFGDLVGYPRKTLYCKIKRVNLEEIVNNLDAIFSKLESMPPE
ncbi:hypothetical protein [Flavilitoribacter nigricans]|uniref:Uncharacterized protein n=1 Tax=Flavilitoribacter nigricans (strain ATCC 23147 / DSM 23189 / NBRC 102662 / NCIMB 1420 / SS-2) TaxID=1122177 RepID=A0A2D0N9F6_FLAN2|nr:hypothetical protein [Flavilitoribacter nigricans]PHN05115.1 hypothetical protein CRP01_19020 [Flavilitoribacter nigricans DSM 23189 = NBRC 102662]